MPTIEILSDQIAYPDTGVINSPIRVIRFRVQEQLQEYQATGKTFAELKANALETMKTVKYPTMVL